MTTTRTLPVETEAAFQKAILKAATLLGWSSYHTRFSVGSKTGFPDLVLWHPRFGFFFAELKREGGKLTSSQAEHLESLSAAARAINVLAEDLYPDHPARVVVGCYRPSDWETVERVLKGEEA